ncbi:MAG: hypothetical protein IH959_09355 [Chloroflexi bacterium]|nr:hypothetical protein [Chloroflexota bacterium]
MTTQTAIPTTEEEPPERQAEAEVPVTLGANGPAMAAILGGAIGVFVLGFLTALAAVAEGVKEWLVFQNRVGSLSGKSVMTGVVWLVVWATLHLLWQKRDVPFAAVMVVSGVLLVVGNLLMFPPIFERLEP